MIANTALTMMVIVVIHLVRIVALNAVVVVQKPSAIMAQVVRTNVKEIADSVIAMILTFPIVLIVEITRTLRAQIVTEIFGVVTKNAIPVITSARYLSAHDVKTSTSISMFSRVALTFSTSK